MSTRSLAFGTLIIILGVLSCRNANNNGQDEAVEETELTGKAAVSDSYYKQIFLENGQGIFREIALDLPQEKVREIESGHILTLSDDKPGYLQYELDLETDTLGGIDYAEVKYIFDETDRLDIITVNYYIQDSSVTNALYNQLNRTFIDRYGDYYIDSDGYTVWESTYLRPDSSEVIFDIGIRKYIKLNFPGLTVEMMRFGSM